jgi:uncharacterized protein YutE (UPF0331/DUF86 family)
MIDAELITRKILLISRDLTALQDLAAQTSAVFLEDATNQVVAERYLERAIGRMIDVNYHLLVESGEPPPPDYYQSFLQLASLGVYPATFGYRIAGCAGLRNRIAHEYDDIVPVKLFDAVRQAVGDIPDYLAHVNAWLERHTPSRRE